MPYDFSFDLTKAPQEFYRILAKAAYEKNVHNRIANAVRQMAEKLKIEEITGLNISDVSLLVQDLADIHFKNITDRERFRMTKKRALFLPHCSRKFMDNRCQASFDENAPTYRCAGCSPDCLVNKSAEMGKNQEQMEAMKKMMGQT